MNNIKSINNINVHSFISFKDKQNFDNANTTPPSLKTNTLIKGLDASANYNKYKKTGQIVIKNENINGMKLYTYEKDGSYTYEEIGYYPKTKTYCIEKADANNNIRMQKFDNNLKPQNP